jgi:hypothetical protein
MQLPFMLNFACVFMRCKIVYGINNPFLFTCRCGIGCVKGKRMMKRRGSSCKDEVFGVFSLHPVWMQSIGLRITELETNTEFYRLFRPSIRAWKRRPNSTPTPPGLSSRGLQFGASHLRIDLETIGTSSPRTALSCSWKPSSERNTLACASLSAAAGR